MRKLQRAHDLATSAIDALNSLYAAPIGSCRGRDPAAAPYSSRVAEVHKYIFDCCSEFAVAPASSDSSASHGFPLQEDEDEAYDDFGIGGATDLLSDLVALPAEGGSFPVADYVGPELAAYAYAEPPACDEADLIRQLHSGLARSCHRASAKEYAALVALDRKAIAKTFKAWKENEESTLELVAKTLEIA